MGTDFFLACPGAYRDGSYLIVFQNILPGGGRQHILRMWTLDVDYVTQNNRSSLAMLAMLAMRVFYDCSELRDQRQSST